MHATSGREYASGGILKRQLPVSPATGTVRMHSGSPIEAGIAVDKRPVQVS